MEKEQAITDKKFYIVMAVAVIALMIGTAGLIVGLVKSSYTAPSVLTPSTNGSSLPDKGTVQEIPGPYTGPNRSGSVQQLAH